MVIIMSTYSTFTVRSAPQAASRTFPNPPGRLAEYFSQIGAFSADLAKVSLVLACIYWKPIIVFRR